MAFVWAASGLLAFVLSGRVDAASVALLGLAPAAVAAVALFVASRGQRGVLLTLASVAATLVVVLAVAGHLLHARGEGLRFAFPPMLGDGLAGALLLLLGLLLVPLGVGIRLRALVLGYDASGADAASSRALLLALTQRHLDDAPRGAHVPLALLRSLGEAWMLPGLLLLDFVTLPARRGRDRLHADVSLPSLAEGLAAEGCHPERLGQGLRVRLPPRAEGDLGGVVLVRPRRLAFPAFESSRALDVSGDAEDVRRLRRLLEGPLCGRIVFSWSRVGRRVEARLNALLHDADRANTLEERGLLLEEVDRMERSLAARDLSPGEWTILVGWKLQRLRGHLLSRMLHEPPGARADGRVPAPAPALLPPLSRVMEAGGLAAMRRAVFVPHWIVPVATAWGERDIVVNALTGRADALDGPRILEAMARQGPSLLVDAARPEAFLPAPAPTAALLRELRVHGGATPVHLAGVELAYVPFVPTEDGYVNAVTGAEAPDLGAAIPAPAA